MTKRFKEAIRILYTGDSLEQDEVPPRESRPSFAGWLLQPEKLPPPAVSVPPARTSFFSWLVVPEKLPTRGQREGEKRKSLVTELLAREELPRDPVPARVKKSFLKKKMNRANKGFR